MGFVYGDKVQIKQGIVLSGDNKDIDAIQSAKLVGMVRNFIKHDSYPIKVDFGDEWGIYPFAEDELEPASPAPSALDTARAALERIANESDLRMSAYLNSDDMLRDYIGKVVRMKRIAADALAGLEGGEQP